LVKTSTDPSDGRGVVLSLTADGRRRIDAAMQAKGATFRQRIASWSEEDLLYCMMKEIRFQKAAMFIGPKRSGKGTITHIIRRLVGDKSYCSLNFSHWTATEKLSTGDDRQARWGVS
jgi:hypothetical protein